MLDKQPFVHEDAEFPLSEQTRNLFGPDVIVIHEYLACLSEQYCSYAGDKTDCSGAGRRHRLLPQILYGQKSTRKRIFAEAGQWIFDRDDDWLFGFDNICEMLKLDPDYIRRVLKQSEQERLLPQLSEHQQTTDFSGNSVAFGVLAALPAPRSTNHIRTDRTSPRLIAS